MQGRITEIEGRIKVKKRQNKGRIEGRKKSPRVEKGQKKGRIKRAEGRIKEQRR